MHSDKVDSSDIQIKSFLTLDQKDEKKESQEEGEISEAEEDNKNEC